MDGIYTFNKENWTGEEATIAVIGNEFEFYGYNFRLVPSVYNYEGKERTNYTVYGDEWDEPLFRILDNCDGAYWCHKYDIERTDANPFVLAAKMAAMTI